MDAVLLLLNLWDKTTSLDDNRSIAQTASAPLVPFLKRFESISNYTTYNTITENEEYNCTSIFRKMLHLPEDDAAEIDLRQAALVIMSHLDRLAMAHIPPQSFNKVFT